jgi:glycosyltransferase involved in cell wall biosynthesis
MFPRRLTVCVPCYGRPERTQRVINCLRNQTVNDFEVFLIGDHCAHFQQKLDNGYFSELIQQESLKGNSWHAWNLFENTGGFGATIRNMMKQLANGKYICFVDNDDWVKEYHVQHYLSEIEKTNYDFVYYNTWNNALNLIRDTQPSMGLIGHSELCIKTSFYKLIPEQVSEYGHDWKMIEQMLSLTNNHAKSQNPDWTYKIMSTPMKREENID